MSEVEIGSFWESHPCGDALVGGLDERFRGDYEDFFTGYDKLKYRVESHIPRCIGELDVRGKRVLEIGLATSRNCSSGAARSGPESISRGKASTECARDSSCEYEQIVQASVLDLPFAASDFELILSHGVLHHVPTSSAPSARFGAS